jgi:hypothetical protein
VAVLTLQHLPSQTNSSFRLPVYVNNVEFNNTMNPSSSQEVPRTDVESISTPSSLPPSHAN